MLKDVLVRDALRLSVPASFVLLFAGCGGGSGAEQPSVDEGTGGGAAIPSTYTVTVNSNGEGVIGDDNGDESGDDSGDNSYTVDAGDSLSIALSPATYHHISSADGCEGQLQQQSYQIDAVNADCTVNVEFANDYVELAVQIPYFAAHGSDELVASIDGLNQVQYQLTSSSGDGLTIRLLADASLSEQKQRMRLRVTGTAADGLPLQLTSNLPSFSSLYNNPVNKYSGDDFAELVVTPLTTVIDSYLQNNLGSGSLVQADYQQQIELLNPSILQDRLAVLHSMANDVNINLPAAIDNTFALLSSTAAIKAFKQSHRIPRHAATQALADLPVSAAYDDNSPLSGVLHQLSYNFGLARSASYLNIDDGTVRYGADHVGWFNLPVPFSWQEGVLERSEQALAGDLLYRCIIATSELQLPDNLAPETYDQLPLSFTLDCEHGLQRVKPLLRENTRHYLAVTGYKYLPEQSVTVAGETFTLPEHTLFSSNLRIYQQLPDDWQIGNEQLTQRAGDSWVLPSVNNGYSGTESFILSGGNSYEQRLMFDDQLATFDQAGASAPGNYDQTGEWLLEAGDTQLRLLPQDGPVATVQKITSTEPSLATQPLYLVRWFRDETLVSEQVMPLMAIDEVLSPDHLISMTDGDNVLRNALPAGVSNRYPEQLGSLFAWSFSNSAMQTLVSLCNGYDLLAGEVCDGDFSIEVLTDSEVQPQNDYLLAMNSYSGGLTRYRAIWVLGRVDDKVLLFEQGIFEYQSALPDGTRYQPYLNGRIVLREQSSL